VNKVTTTNVLRKLVTSLLTVDVVFN